MKDYEPTKFFEFLGYTPGSTPYSCKDLRTLNVYCRGDRSQLEQFLALTPFELADDRFVISIADFANVTLNPFYDAAVIIPVAFEGHRGGCYFFEFENHSYSVAAGRELWGYPKKFADCALAAEELGAHGSVSLRGENIFDIRVEYDPSVTGEAWKGFQTYPHLLVRWVPQFNGPGFQHLDVLSRDTSKDFVLKSRQYGRAEAIVGPALAVGDSVLKVVDVLGGEYVVGDYASVAEPGHGLPVLIRSLV